MNSWVVLINSTSRRWFWKTPPSMVRSSTASAWWTTRLWTWSQETTSHLGFSTANSGDFPHTGSSYERHSFWACCCYHWPVCELYLSVDHQKPVVCSSCMDNNGKVLLSEALLALGGKLVNTWSQECTHLVMTSAKVTIKVGTRLWNLVFNPR